MFKALLLICVVVAAMSVSGQSTSAEIDGPAQVLRQDPAGIISDLTCFPSGKTSAVVSWKAPKELPGFFVIERSDDGMNFETVSVMNKPTPRPSFQVVDEAPRRGKNFYRIRYSFDDGQPLFSTTVSCTVEGASAFKFYPNPADNILIVRSESAVDVQISDGNGRVRVSEPAIQGLRTINVSSLEKGIYIIRFTNKLTNIISQDKLVKN